MGPLPTRRDFAATGAVALGVTHSGTVVAAEKDPVRVVVWDERQPQQKEAYENFLGNQTEEDLQTLRAFATGLPVPKPVVVEETFPLQCSPGELEQFIRKADGDAAGWISFYWGKPPEELRRGKTIVDKLLLQWLEIFARGWPKN